MVIQIFRYCQRSTCMIIMCMGQNKCVQMCKSKIRKQPDNMFTARNISGINHHRPAVRKNGQRTIPAFCPDPPLRQSGSEQVQIPVTAIGECSPCTLDDLLILVGRLLFLRYRSPGHSCSSEILSLSPQQTPVVRCGHADQDPLPLYRCSFIYHRVQCFIPSKRPHVHIFQTCRQPHLLQCRASLESLCPDHPHPSGQCDLF